MRRISFAALFALLLLPAAAEAQIPRAMVGGGLSTPTGTFGDMADPGWHGRLGLQLGAPLFPLAARVEGEYHSFGQPTGGTQYKVLDGTLNAVLRLTGVGITPYFMAGVGRYRVDTETATTDPDPFVETGFQGGFGVEIGALGFGGFAEFRIVQINTEGEKIRYFPISVGFRL